MKNSKSLLILVMIFGMLIVCHQAYSQTIRDADGNTYNTITIGTQHWMEENLSVSHFKNGETIPEVKTQEEWQKAGEEKRPVWCFYEFMEENGRKYGRLYNWFAVNDSRGLAPIGWHVAKTSDWNMLVKSLGSDSVAGYKLKSKEGWHKNGDGSNSSGFSGLPGGHLSGLFGFSDMGAFGEFWSSTENDVETAWMFALSFASKGTDRNIETKTVGLAVRCVKD